MIIISTFLNILRRGKTQIKSGYSWNDNLEALKSLPEEMEKSSKTGLVSEDTTREEFKSRFNNLTWARVACLLALIFSIGKSIDPGSLAGMLGSVAAVIFFAIILLQYSYKSWMCIKIWNSWEKRHKLKKPGFTRFLNDAFSKPLTLFQYTLK